MTRGFRWVGLAVVALAVACGGGGGSNTLPDGDAPLIQSFGLLRPVTDAAQMTRSLQEGLAGAAFVSSAEEPIRFELDDVPPGAPESDAAGRFSTTNLQEPGVDESDLVKYDGAVLYVLDRSGPDQPLPTEPGPTDTGIVAPGALSARIRLFATDLAAPTAEQVGEIQLDGEYFQEGGLYLAEVSGTTQLIAVGQSSPFVPWEVFAVDYYWQEGRTTVSAWDVADPASPGELWSIVLEGNLLTSRRIDNMLYLVTRFTPTVEGLVPYPVEEEQVEMNRILIEETPLASLLPDLVRDGGEPEELLEATDCLVPNPDYEDLAPPPPSGSLVTVTAIDLTAPDRVTSLCLNTFASGFYASTDSLYLTTNGIGNETMIHKIRLSGGEAAYRGSGVVPGYLGTRSPAFLMSEDGVDLRVVSSLWRDRVFPMPVVDVIFEEASDPPEEDYGPHRLTVLRESADGTRLEVVARLPNSRRPAPIGKPGEDIYAVRFVGDRAYAVTFEVIDPLYVIDLSDAEDPQITGELELPGFSTLLQPLSEELLLGVGAEVPASAGGITQGVKVALFNVADVAAPIELGSEVIGRRGSYSPALDDHHAFSLLEVDGRYRAAIPVERHDTLQEAEDVPVEDPWYWYAWSDSGLYQFDIDPSSGSLSRAGALIIESRDDDRQFPRYDLYESRGVLHEDAVFFVRAPMVWAGRWGD